ncbi:hypothetical protein MNBD_ALPHA04-831 [hydrothermal vent metagenome]|uniref:Methanolan biosynthesis EpsI domain-containing protein n=1 Tax=hydrothermal vent metagenome TaxID=652676 RepID=A0A3B0RS96_9ZZZZ
MIGRRDLLIGASCVAALGTAEWLRPRKLIKLMDAETVEEIVPTKFGNWSSQFDAGLIVPKTPGSLADRLYSETITRRYKNSETGAQVMLLIAYGGAQNDLLQLHRPESCYPAVGFEITQRRMAAVELAKTSIPSVFLTAEARGRVEDVLYFTRIGEYLPRSAGEQRSDRLSAAMKGYVGDGILVRASTIRRGKSDSLPRLSDFLGGLMAAVSPDVRKAFIGTERATALV